MDIGCAEPGEQNRGEAIQDNVKATLNFWGYLMLLRHPNLGWFAPPESTQAWEPTLLWNHFTHNPLKRRMESAQLCKRLMQALGIDDAGSE